MKHLEYRVAWIDDQPDHANGFEQRLRANLARQGLELTVQWVSTEAKLKEFIDQLNDESNFDVILVDSSLGEQMGEGASGASVSRRIREQHSHATVIFYSAAPVKDLRERIAKESIDGVWCVNRNYFVHEVWHILRASLRRLDLNAMRGLVVAAVADFDHSIRGALIQAYNKLDPGEQAALVDSLLASKTAFAKQTAEKCEAVDRQQSFTKILDEAHAGSYDLYVLLKELNRKAGHIDPQHRPVCELLERFEADVLTMRNDLAHARTDFSGGKQVLKRAGRDYDTDRFSQLRTILMDHDDNLRLVGEKYIPEVVQRLAAKK